MPATATSAPATKSSVTPKAAAALKQPPAKLPQGPLSGKPKAAPASSVNAPEKPAKPPKEPKEPKVRLSATEEELQAAIDGTLEPRANAEELAKNSSSTETNENGHSKGRPVGATTGFPILLAWCYIFQYNEKEDTNPKWTDEDISNWIKSEFPGRETAAFNNVAGCRMSYNKGAYTRNIKPKVQSKRYNADGTEYVRPKKEKPAKAAPEAAEAEEEAPATAPKASKPAPAAAKPAAKAPAAKAAAPAAKPAVKKPAPPTKK